MLIGMAYYCKLKRHYRSLYSTRHPLAARCLRRNNAGRRALLNDAGQPVRAKSPAPFRFSRDKPRSVITAQSTRCTRQFPHTVLGRFHFRASAIGTTRAA